MEPKPILDALACPRCGGSPCFGVYLMCQVEALNARGAELREKLVKIGYAKSIEELQALCPECGEPASFPVAHRTECSVGLSCSEGMRNETPEENMARLGSGLFNNTRFIYPDEKVFLDVPIRNNSGLLSRLKTWLKDML